jgi:tetratricopeptide (TPR) repeat protein
MTDNLPLNPLPESKDWRRVLFVSGLLVAIVFAVFSQTLKHDFVNFDDETYFTANPHVNTGLSAHNAAWAFQIGYAANWHPLTWLSLMFDAQLFGHGPMGPHLTNVMLHATNTVLLFLLLRRLTGSLWPSAFTAAVFAIHPLHVESVAWVAERKDVLSGLFFMLTLLAYVHYAERSGPQFRMRGIFYGLTLLFFVLGLMSKPILVTLPFVLLLLDHWPLARLKRDTFWPLVIEKVPFFLFSAASCVLTILAQKQAITPTVALSLWSRIGNAMTSYVIYLGQMFYPTGLAAFYPHPENNLHVWAILFSLMILASITAVALALRRTRPYLLVGWLWYLGILVPVIGLLQVGGQARADRYTYLPLIGVLIMVAWAVKDLSATWRQRQSMLTVAALIVILPLMVTASIQTTYWQNSETLWRHTLACTWQNYVAHTDLGSALVKQGRISEAMEEYKIALGINPQYLEANNNIGILLARQGQTADAIGYYQKALEIKPDFVEAHVNLGNALSLEGQTDEAAEHFEKALQLDPSEAEAHNDWGAMLLARGRAAAAVDHFETAVEINPAYSEAQNNLGSALAAQGQTTGALTHFQKAIELKPGYANAHYNLANLYAAQGRVDEAIAHYQTALELVPNFVKAHYQLGLALQGSGKFAEAAEQFQTVLDLDARQIGALNDLAWMLATCPQDTFRNGIRAVELATKAEQLTQSRSPEILDTLAAAYAEAGRFPDAVQTVKKAMAMATDQNKNVLAAALQNRLHLYQANFPFRDTTMAAPAVSRKP